MAMNGQERQLEVAREAEELLRTLAHSTRDMPNQRDSYSMIGELGAIIDYVAQICNQLASWHSRLEDGKCYRQYESCRRRAEVRQPGCTLETDNLPETKLGGCKDMRGGGTNETEHS